MQAYPGEPHKEVYLEIHITCWGTGPICEKKKGGSLHLCTDFQALSQITIHNRYPLPLILELSKLDLYGAFFFFKLAHILCSILNLVRALWVSGLPIWFDQCPSDIPASG